MRRKPQSRAKWTTAGGASNVDVSRGPVLNQASMALDGQAIALARSALAAWERIAGRLLRPFALPLSYAYWIVCSKTAVAECRGVSRVAGVGAEADAQRLMRMRP